MNCAGGMCGKRIRCSGVPVGSSGRDNRRAGHEPVVGCSWHRRGLFGREAAVDICVRQLEEVLPRRDVATCFNYFRYNRERRWIDEKSFDKKIGDCPDPPEPTRSPAGPSQTSESIQEILRSTKDRCSRAHTQIDKM